jgi:hypothetical protein
MTFKQRAAIAVVAFLAGFATTSLAQAPLVRVDVPFKFHVGDQVYRAGTYQVRTDRGMGRVAISSVEQPEACIVPIKIGFIGQSPERGTLTFRSYGRAYFLYRIQGAGSPDGVELFTSSSEREMARLTPPAEVALSFAPAR